MKYTVSLRANIEVEVEADTPAIAVESARLIGAKDPAAVRWLPECVDYAPDEGVAGGWDVVGRCACDRWLLGNEAYGRSEDGEDVCDACRPPGEDSFPF